MIPRLGAVASPKSGDFGYVVHSLGARALSGSVDAATQFVLVVVAQNGFHRRLELVGRFVVARGDALLDLG